MESVADGPIYFYSKVDAYAELSNFSPHGFAVEGVYWPTVEHFFQAQKFPSNPEYQEKIRLAPHPRIAKSLGRTRKLPVRPDWDVFRDAVMARALLAKFTAHPALATMLLQTGTRKLVESAPMDGYWGCGKSGTGRNRLGELLMDLRAQLRASRT